MDDLWAFDLSILLHSGNKISGRFLEYIDRLKLIAPPNFLVFFCCLFLEPLSKISYCKRSESTDFIVLCVLLKIFLQNSSFMTWTKIFHWNMWLVKKHFIWTKKSNWGHWFKKVQLTIGFSPWIYEYWQYIDNCISHSHGRASFFIYILIK